MTLCHQSKNGKKFLKAIETFKEAKLLPKLVQQSLIAVLATLRDSEAQKNS